MACGYNLYGQLGIGSNTNQNSPVLIPSLSDVKFITTGFSSSYALLSNKYSNNNLFPFFLKFLQKNICKKMMEQL